MNITRNTMESKFNFNSQVATSRSQSERLLALGLKKETADFPVWGTEGLLYMAWSLHRLIEMIKDGAIRKDGTDEDLSLDISGGDLYDGTIDAIEWLIKEGYFPKEYLV